MKMRKPTKTEQAKTQKAYELLFDVIEDHQKEIEPYLWKAAMVCALAENCRKSGISFEEFKKMMSQLTDHYKY